MGLGRFMSTRFGLFTSTFLSSVSGAFFTTLTAQAADLGTLETGAVDKAAFAYAAATLPAVDGINGKAEALGGTLGHKTLGGAAGAFTVPLGYQYGAQIDLQGGSLGGGGFGSIGGHAFWRNPGSGLLGAYVSHTYWDSAFGGVHVTQVGGEGEYYFGRWTLQGVAGVEFGDSASRSTASIVTVVPPVGGKFGLPAGTISTATFIQGYDVKTQFFDQINLKYYFQDNWATYIGHRYLGGQNALALGSEWALPVNNTIMASAFVEGRIGSGNSQGVWLGLKAYFGQRNKTLIERHRQDDPPIWSALASAVNSYFQSGNRGAQYFCPAGEVLSGTVCNQAPTFSDIRLKSDIALVGRLGNGLGLYRFRYIGGDEIYVGVMAHEVAAVMPEAVVQDADGYLRVRYDMLGIRMQTWDEWSTLPALAPHRAELSALI